MTKKYHTGITNNEGKHIGWIDERYSSLKRGLNLVSPLRVDGAIIQRGTPADSINEEILEYGRLKYPHEPLTARMIEKIESEMRAEKMSAGIENEIQNAIDISLQRRERMIEAVWRSIVKDDTPEREDGELIQLRTPKEAGEEKTYIFRYKQKEMATLIEQIEYGETRFFIQSEYCEVKDVMKNYWKLVGE